MAEPNTIYKLTVLYMLEKLDTPLTGTQITDFFLTRGYTDYFTVQTTLNDLEISGLIASESTHNNTLYHVTPAGKETLRYLGEKLTSDIRSDVSSFCAENALSIREENALLADYYKTAGQGYAIRLQYREKDQQKIDLTLAVPNKEAAEAACRNWRSLSGDVYAYLLELLMG